ncbi:RNA polymerase sigma factor [Larkinella arboricola]|uniref:RNA polymerase sigma-70 factor (ECF subfamily) n=1 Tax=Larkinella arboricola TaxID=643671 RepID=A0A327X4W3_LARAB|nr:RNA polymerase sigma factor [Larkinella arboricola]RAK02067.1 RNA polymerase sigma-70 factor (ECF subfamily) [Larkinella arboricola]
MTVPSPDIAGLLQECQNGNRRSQELLYRQFYGYAMGICLRYSHNRDEAVEILNDGFMKVFTRSNLYRSEVPFKLWLRRIMINTALDYYRQNLKHRYHEDIDQASQLPGVDASALDQLSHEELMEVVQLLTPAYRMVFNLYAIDGYSHEEIAGQLNISVGTSKSNLARAREQLKQLLIRRYHGEFARTSR